MIATVASKIFRHGLVLFSHANICDSGPTGITIFTLKKMQTTMKMVRHFSFLTSKIFVLRVRESLKYFFFMLRFRLISSHQHMQKSLKKYFIEAKEFLWNLFATLVSWFRGWWIWCGNSLFCVPKVIWDEAWWWIFCIWFSKG